jgi:hypothetical protein
MENSIIYENYLIIFIEKGYFCVKRYKYLYGSIDEINKKEGIINFRKEKEIIKYINEWIE